MPRKIFLSCESIDYHNDQESAVRQETTIRHYMSADLKAEITLATKHHAYNSQWILHTAYHIIFHFSNLSRATISTGTLGHAHGDTNLKPFITISYQTNMGLSELQVYKTLIRSGGKAHWRGATLWDLLKSGNDPETTSLCV
jgi:hypothetical protein